MQSKYVHSPQSLSSSLTVDTFKSRKPRFQRQNTSGKCECKSASRSRLSCDSLSLQKLYVKKSFLKSPGNYLDDKNDQSSSRLTIFHSLIGESQINQISSSCVQKKVDCQFLNDSKYLAQTKFESFLYKQDDEKIDAKQKIQKSLKEAIFYKQKCQKYELRIKDLINQKEKFATEFKTLKQENQKLKIEIQNFKKTTIMQVQKEQSQYLTQKKPRISINKNLSKLKQQYVNFRQQEDLNKVLSDQRFQKVSKKLQQLKSQNEKLREDIIQQNQFYNLKLKMMQQKQDFLEKTLSFTKNTLAQLQKDYSQKQLEILQAKRLNEIINEKNNHIEKVQHKYNNLIKIINGEKKRGYNQKSTNNKPQKVTVPLQLKSNHSLQTKNAIFSHKQNNLYDQQIKKTPLKNNQKYDKNSIMIKITNGQIKTKQNHRISQLKSTLNLPTKQIQQRRLFRKTNSDLTLSSFNSLQLSPEK